MSVGWFRVASISDSGTLSSKSGVDMDTEMSNMIALQNAYGANAKVIAAVQAMWTQLLTTVS